MIQRWERFVSLPDEDDEYGVGSHGWRHKAGAKHSQLGTVKEYACDSDGWIDGDHYMPDGEFTGGIQVSLEVVAEKKKDERQPFVMAVYAYKVSFDDKYYFQREVDGFEWRYWQPLANARATD